MRYERKFPSSDLSPAALEQMILRHPAGFRKVSPDRRVNNIYFDTPGWRSFYDNLAGISLRAKYRLRWYGPQTGTLTGARFELKKKENLLGTKIIYPLDTKMLWHEVPLLIRNIPRLKDAGLAPTLVNCYYRAYYESADATFRLTLDTDLQCGVYLPQGMLLRPMAWRLAVVELKYAEDHAGRLDEITQYWPLRALRFSKYVTGMQMAYA